jgi:L-ascorbate oxidase
VMSFGWEKGRKGTGLTNGAAPRFTIDGVQFSESRIDQYLTLGTEEEWTLYNYTSIAHPFHIHVNPFQVTEIFTPPNAKAKTPATTYAPTSNFVWQDVVAIPPAETDANGQLILNAKGFATNPGRVVIRQKYADFAGTFVLHCHILAHEDRGMMQLVQIVDPKSIMVHHH